MGRGYPDAVSAISEESRSLRAAIASNRAELAEVLARYAATNPRLIGSVARGDARPGSDVDVLVDLEPGRGNPLLRIAGIAEELNQLLGVRVDVVAEELLRDEVSAGAHRDAVPL